MKKTNTQEIENITRDIQNMINSRNEYHQSLLKLYPKGFVIVDDLFSYVAVEKNQGIHGLGIHFLGAKGIKVYTTETEAHNRICTSLLCLHSYKRHLHFKIIPLEKYVIKVQENNDEILKFINNKE